MNFEKVIAVRPTKTVYKDKDKAIKVFDENFSKANVLNEALNQARVEETGLCIPRLHEVTKTDGKWTLVFDYIEGKTLETLMKLKDKMERKISETDLDTTTRYDLHTRLEGMPKHKKVCHGDFNPSNIIISTDGTPYILDWSHATQGNAAADAARTYLLFKLSKKDEIAEKYLNLFCRKTETAKQYVQKWIPIVAASQLVKGNEEEREFLLSWIDVVEYE